MRSLSHLPSLFTCNWLHFQFPLFLVAAAFSCGSDNAPNKPECSEFSGYNESTLPKCKIRSKRYTPTNAPTSVAVVVTKPAFAVCELFPAFSYTYIFFLIWLWQKEINADTGIEDSRKKKSKKLLQQTNKQSNKGCKSNKFPSCQSAPKSQDVPRSHLSSLLTTLMYPRIG